MEVRAGEPAGWPATVLVKLPTIAASNGAIPAARLGAGTSHPEAAGAVSKSRLETTGSARQSAATAVSRRVRPPTRRAPWAAAIAKKGTASCHANG